MFILLKFADSAEVIQEACVSNHSKTFVIVGDNLDKTINPRFMTATHQRQSVHYFHSYAVRDRIESISTLAADKPVGDISRLSPSSYLPDAADCYAILLAPVLITTFKRCFLTVQ